MKNFKITIDEGFSNKLVEGATFIGFYDFPVVDAPRKIVVPKNIVPFSKRKYLLSDNDAICFNEYEKSFADVLRNPENYVEEFKKYVAIISTDFSLYTSAPLAVKIANLYRNHALAGYYQRQGVNVIPFIRWGSVDTFEPSINNEKLAFIGYPKHSMVAIGTYGCCKKVDDKEIFRKGLIAMLEELEPKIVLVYGAMPKDIFKDLTNKTTFYQYADWTTLMHQGGYSGWR